MNVKEWRRGDTIWRNGKFGSLKIFFSVMIISYHIRWKLPAETAWFSMKTYRLCLILALAILLPLLRIKNSVADFRRSLMRLGEWYLKCQHHVA